MSSVIDEYIVFCNEVITGEQIVNEDSIPSVIKSNNTMSALQQRVSQVINDHSSIIDQNILADKKIKVDCGNQKLSKFHLQPRKKEYRTYNIKTVLLYIRHSLNLLVRFLD